jgi:hypothetical protein
MTDKDDLFKGIDDAADNLFSQYVVKKGESAPIPEVDTKSADSAPPSSLQPEPEPESPSLEIESASAPSPAPVNVGGGGEETDPMAQMEEVLLSIDWEVSQSNLNKGREVLKKLVGHYGLDTDSPASLVAAQMDNVLASMQDNPETVPVSAPSQLKKALDAIRSAVDQGSNPDAATRKLLTQTLSELNAVVAARPEGNSGLELNLSLESAPPQPLSPLGQDVPPASPQNTSDIAASSKPIENFGMELSLESDTIQEQQGAPVKPETTRVLKAYSEALSSAIKNISPMEKLFANRTGMEKLHKVNKHVRDKLKGQVKLLSQTFSSDYSNYNGLGTVNGWLESQLDILNPCVKRLVKVENLFAKTKGYEKLHDLTKKIRTSLAAQQEAITIAVGGVSVTHQFDLTGEYPALQPVLDRAPEEPAPTVSAAADPEALLDSCLDLARQIESGEVEPGREIGQKLKDILEKAKSALAGSAFSSPSTAAAANTAISTASGNHNAKCRWDWLLKTSWGSQLVGLAPEQVAFESHNTFPIKAFRDKTYFSLNKLKTFPWTNLQSLFSGDLAEVDKSTLNDMELEIASPPETFRGSTQKKVYLAIMYHEGKGKVFLLDSPTEAISITEEGLWVPGKQGSDIAGTLTVYGSIMPVLALD